MLSQYRLAVAKKWWKYILCREEAQKTEARWVHRLALWGISSPLVVITWGLFFLSALFLMPWKGWLAMSAAVGLGVLLLPFVCWKMYHDQYQLLAPLCPHWGPLLATKEAAWRHRMLERHLRRSVPSAQRGPRF